METTEHKCLQTQFSVLYNEAMQLKTMLELEKTRGQLQMSKNAHMRQIEQEEEALLSETQVKLVLFLKNETFFNVISFRLKLRTKLCETLN